MRVVVAGAGLSGLTAAYTLRGMGASVRMFEARDRIGGRVWTYRGPPMAPFHGELGGELIESDHDALRRLSGELDLTLKRILLRGFGLAIAQRERVRVLRRQTPLWKTFSAMFDPHVRALDEAGNDWSSTAAAAVAKLSLQNVLDAGGASAPVKALGRALRNLYVADPDQLSALVAAEEVRGGGDPTAMASYRIVGGNDRLAAAMATSARLRIDLQHVVRAVEQRQGRVSVKVEASNGRVAELSTDFVVLALPVPLLRRVRFSPPLPAIQRQALETVSVGPATKALLRFSTAWWRKPGLPRAFGTDLPIGAVWDASEDQPAAALLTLLAGGRASAQLRRLLTSRRGPELTRQLRWLNGGPRERPVIHSVSWERDPWAQGAYEYFSPSFDPALQPLLGRGFGRVFFAGAHTSREFPGYMNGAVESGKRAAREIVALAELRTKN